MKLLSVNVSLPRGVLYNSQRISTGIFKEPTAGRVRLGKLNLAGDGQADLNAHGGVHKAVYAYPFEHYAHWEHALDRADFACGQFGENFTVQGLLEDAVCIGDVFQVGSARVEVSQPRTPCYKLGVRMGRPTFPKAFMESGRTGFYLRVLEEGEVGAGDVIECVMAGAGGMTVKEVFRLMYFAQHVDRNAIAKVLRLPVLSPEWRTRFLQLLERDE